VPAVTADAGPALPDFDRRKLAMTVTEGDRDSHAMVLREGPEELVGLAAVPAEVQAAVTGEWVATCIRLTTQCLLSYAADPKARRPVVTRVRPGPEMACLDHRSRY
jgi:hypothetical protein